MQNLEKLQKMVNDLNSIKDDVYSIEFNELHLDSSASRIVDELENAINRVDTIIYEIKDK